MSSNFNDTTPAAPAGGLNVKWQTDGNGNDSAYVPGGGGAGVNSQTANYTAVAADSGKLISFNSASAVTLTLPATPPSVNWKISVEDVGAGTLTISRNGLLIDGAASNLTVTTNSGVVIYTDGTNYFTERGLAGGSGVASLNALTGALTLVAGSNITITPAGSNITIAASGGGSSLPPSANGWMFDSVWSVNTSAGGMSLRYGPDSWTNLGTIFNVFTASTTTVAGYTTFSAGAANTPNGGYSTCDSGQFYIWSPVNFSLQMEFVCNVSQVSDCLFYGGFFDRSAVGGTFGGTTVGNTRGCYFRFDTTAGDTNYQCITATGSAKTTTNSGIAADAHSHTFGIYHNSAGTYFYIDGVQVAHNTTNLPTTGPNPGYQISSAYASTNNQLGMTALHIGMGV